MGAQLIYGTAGASGGGWSAQPATLQPTYEERLHEPRWQWQARALKTWKDRQCWRSLWSYGFRATGAAAVVGLDGAATLGQSMTDPDLYEPYSADGEGCQTLVFIKGQCVDASGNPLAGVNVRAFRTSDNAFAGYVVQSRVDGSYDVPTNFPGVEHYVVAYLPGSPDRGGTTVNTLVPTNIDGT